ncbi:MAG: trimeric intracellular cation channel family protein [Salinarimonas sp.]|nr:trimeric intracellular cation channel family protein [Salinarimonas sp.]
MFGLFEDPGAIAIATRLIDFLGVAAFAASGALVASRKQMDIVGFTLLAVVTGIGGGTMRDLLLGLPVFWIARPDYLLICVAMAIAAFFTAHLVASRYKVLLWCDAAGLALFAVVGAETALLAGAGPLVALVMGMITATFGGVIRDVLGAEEPVILSREIYATAALAGAGGFVLLDALGLARDAALIVALVIGFGIRGFALTRGWSLPRYRQRPGRDPADIP